MKKTIQEKRERNTMKSIGIVLPFFPKLLFKSSIIFLRFKRRAKKAGRVFQKELRKHGVDKQTATELTDVYLNNSKLKNFIQTFR